MSTAPKGMHTRCVTPEAGSGQLGNVCIGGSMSQVEHAQTVSSRPMMGILGGIGMLLLGLSALLFAVSFASRPLAPKTTPPSTPRPENVSSAGPGFELVQLGSFRRDQFLVDQKSGRIWQSSCLGNVSGADCSGLLIWQEMYVDGITPSDSNAATAFNETLRSQSVGKK